MDAHSPAQLRDRIKSMRLANIYEPQHCRHIVSGVQIVGGDAQGGLQVRSNFLVVRTMGLDGDMKLFATGQCEDLVDVTGAQPLFARRHFKLDSRLVETLMVIPL